MFRTNHEAKKHCKKPTPKTTTTTVPKKCDHPTTTTTVEATTTTTLPKATTTTSTPETTTTVGSNESTTTTQPANTSTTVATSTTTFIGGTVGVCQEDMPCWDCHTMGNHVCGTSTTTSVLAHTPTLPTTGNDSGMLAAGGLGIVMLGALVLAIFRGDKRQ